LPPDGGADRLPDFVDVGLATFSPTSDALDQLISHASGQSMNMTDQSLDHHGIALWVRSLVAAHDISEDDIREVLGALERLGKNTDTSLSLNRLQLASLPMVDTTWPTDEQSHSYIDAAFDSPCGLGLCFNKPEIKNMSTQISINNAPDSVIAALITAILAIGCWRLGFLVMEEKENSAKGYALLERALESRHTWNVGEYSILKLQVWPKIGSHIAFSILTYPLLKALVAMVCTYTFLQVTKWHELTQSKTVCCEELGHPMRGEVVAAWAHHIRMLFNDTGGSIFAQDHVRCGFWIIYCLEKQIAMSTGTFSVSYPATPVLRDLPTSIYDS
jgi:hypothetical protein